MPKVLTLTTFAPLPHPSAVVFPAASATLARATFTSPATSKALTPFQWRVYDIILQVLHGPAGSASER